jgi:hypothetical protein
MNNSDVRSLKPHTASTGIIRSNCLRHISVPSALRSFVALYMAADIVA